MKPLQKKFILVFNFQKKLKANNRLVLGAKLPPAASNTQAAPPPQHGRWIINPLTPSLFYYTPIPSAIERTSLTILRHEWWSVNASEVAVNGERE
jgi:hypothetical protein